MREAEPAGGPARLLPSGDAYFLLDGAERELLVPDPIGVAAVDVARLARSAAARRGDPRDVAAGEPPGQDRDLGRRDGGGARGRRGGGRRPAAARPRGRHRGRVERVSAAASAQAGLPAIRSAIRSPMATVVRCVFARGTVGMMEASATTTPSCSRTRPSPSTTRPMAHVPVGWKKPARSRARAPARRPRAPAGPRARRSGPAPARARAPATVRRPRRRRRRRGSRPGSRASRPGDRADPSIAGARFRASAASCRTPPR